MIVFRHVSSFTKNHAWLTLFNLFVRFSFPVNGLIDNEVDLFEDDAIGGNAVSRWNLQHIANNEIMNGHGGCRSISASVNDYCLIVHLVFQL